MSDTRVKESAAARQPDLVDLAARHSTSGLRGVARFMTIYPGWYAGRATHIHIEVFVNNRSVKTSQIAFPEEINSAVYASGVYASKATEPDQEDRDGIFSDGFTSEQATVTGNTTSGYNATFRVGIMV